MTSVALSSWPVMTDRDEGQHRPRIEKLRALIMGK